MAGKRYALLIGCGAYRNAEFPPLAKPAQDVSDLAALLRDPVVGGFEVIERVNCCWHEVRKDIQRFFMPRDPNDLLLLYFSGHGRREAGELYFAFGETEADALESTAIDADFVRKQISRSVAKRKVILLDCCYSGMFGAKGATENAADTVKALEFDSEGRIILTACGVAEKAMEIAPDGSDMPHSLFTHFVIEGIKTGEADKGDGYVDAEELFEYVEWKMNAIAAKQTPKKFSFAQHGKLIVARNPFWKPTPKLPKRLRGMLKNPDTSIRSQAINELMQIIRGKDEVIARLAFKALRRLSRNDAEPLVRFAAKTHLEKIVTPPQNFTVDLGQGVTLELVAIPGGTFWMGSPDGEGSDDEHPRHQVTVAPFYMGKYPVTQAQWRAVMGNNPSTFKDVDRPVEFVSWDNCQEFVQKLNAASSVGALHVTPLQFRLPTEAEWEYACRAGTQTAYSFGDDPAQLKAYAWYSENSDKETHPVGQKQPNAFDLYDMHGNVWEWCADTWHRNYTGAPTDGSVWERGDSDRYVLRGGSWYSNVTNLRCAVRVRDHGQIHWSDDGGFRLACSRRVSVSPF